MRKFWLLVLVVGYFFTGSVQVDAATLSVSPGTGVHTLGSSFTVRLQLNTIGQSINAAEGVLSFDPSELSVVSLSRSGSIFNLWTVEPTFSNSAGTISFGGGSPSGYQGSAGTILSATFRTKIAGTPRISFSNGSVLAADGRGTNILSDMNGGRYTVSAVTSSPEPEEIIEYVPRANTPVAPVITSNTHPNPDAWYQTSEAQISWTVPAGVTGVRTLLDANPASVPTKVYDTPISELNVELDQGVSYLHVQFRNADGWGRVAHYRLAVDSEKPTRLDLRLPDGADLANPEQILEVITADQTSPVTEYLVKVDAAEPFRHIDESASGTIPLPPLDPGYHTVVVEAFDAAGNSIIQTISFTISAFDRPTFTEYPTEISETVIPVIRGITRPASDVIVTISKVGGSDQTEYTVQADESGIFTVIPDGTFSEGVYELSAIAFDQQGAQSEPSAVIRLVVSPPGYIKIGSLLVSFMSILVPLLALLLVTIFGLLYFVSRIRRIGVFVRRETKEAVEVFDTEFLQIEETLLSEAKTLAQSRKTKQLTKGEQQLLDAVQMQIKSSKQRLRREISEVDDIVE